MSAEAARLQKEIAKVTEEIARLHKKLSNEKFVANAPEEIVAAEREKLAEFLEAQAKLQMALSRVREAGLNRIAVVLGDAGADQRIGHAAANAGSAAIFRRNVAIM